MIDPGCLRDVKVAGAAALHAQGWRRTVAEEAGAIADLDRPPGMLTCWRARRSDALQAPGVTSSVSTEG
jgi:hypothetical protein